MIICQTKIDVNLDKNQNLIFAKIKKNCTQKKHLQHLRNLSLEGESNIFKK